MDALNLQAQAQQATAAAMRHKCRGQDHATERSRYQAWPVKRGAFRSGGTGTPLALDEWKMVAASSTLRWWKFRVTAQLQALMAMVLPGQRPFVVRLLIPPSMSRGGLLVSPMRPNSGGKAGQSRGFRPMRSCLPRIGQVAVDGAMSIGRAWGEFRPSQVRERGGRLRRIHQYRLAMLQLREARNMATEAAAARAKASWRPIENSHSHRFPESAGQDSSNGRSQRHGQRQRQHRKATSRLMRLHSETRWA